MLTTVGALRQLLTEALKKSDAEALARTLEGVAGKSGAQVRASVDASGGMFNVFVRLVTGDDVALEGSLVAAAGRLGWSLLSKSERKGVVWWFEPTAEIKGTVPRSKLPPVLYHVTQRRNVASILETGLVPRQREFSGTSRKYSPRVYLATSRAGAEATINREGDWALLQVDVGRLPKGFKFYVDQEFGHHKTGVPLAVYTTAAVPPGAISEVSA